MKRHKVLEPFSRDHYGGLVVARHLKQNPGPDSVAELVKVWEAEMRDHFEEEERLLAPLASPDQASRLRQEHDEIRDEIAAAIEGTADKERLQALGDKIHDHIRWEERELFPQVEAHHSLLNISDASEAMELRRHGSPLAGRRGELVQRRANEGN